MTQETATHETQETTTREARGTTTYETRVPPKESPAECPHCGRPLESSELLVLHEGLDHWDLLGEDEREAFFDAYENENATLRTFRLKMLGLLVLLYFGFLFVYSVMTNDPLSAALFVAWVPDAARRRFGAL